MVIADCKDLNSRILKHDSNAPRYTSYPTAPHFSAAVGDDKYGFWLEALPKQNSLSLYFHIPYCNALCWYCGCYTKITQRYAPIEDYAHLVAREVQMVSALLKEKNHQVSHIHFGGGSPTILLPRDFEFLMKKIRESFHVLSDAEIAIEVDPRSVNEEKISTYARLSVNRISIGVQDFNEKVQRAINRQQSFDLVYDCVKLFRKHGISDINLDLIYGLPLQDLEMIRKNIDYAMLLNPSRIAFFAYAHVQWMKKHMRLIRDEDLPNNALRLEMYQLAKEKLQQEGFVAIGLDHFARPDDSMAQAFAQKKLKRNFQGYSADKAEAIIGFGASAIGHLPFGYVQNIADMEEYKKSILSEMLAVRKGAAVIQEDVLRKKVIDEIMCYLRVDLNQICDAFNLQRSHFAKEVLLLDELRCDGLIAIENNVIKVLESAPQIARLVARCFDEYFVCSEKKHSKIA